MSKDRVLRILRTLFVETHTIIYTQRPIGVLLLSNGPLGRYTSLPTLKSGSETGDPFSLPVPRSPTQLGVTGY